MAELLRSYLADQWITATDSADSALELLDASTSQPVARWSNEPVDVAAAYDYARSVGGPALQSSGRADVAELVDAHGSGPCARKGVEVQVLSSA